MTEPIKLCCDCKHYKRDWGARITGFGDTFDLCLNPVLSENLVTGKHKGGYVCRFMRLYSGECGKNGKYWEARK